MKGTLRFSWLLYLGVGAVLLVGCSRPPSEPPGTRESTRPEAREEELTTEGFTITQPKSGDVVQTDPEGRTTVRGMGAVPNATIEVIVRTDTLYPQIGQDIKIAADGKWSFWPCYLKGGGRWQKHHHIEAVMTTPDGDQYFDEVDDVETTWRPGG